MKSKTILIIIIIVVIICIIYYFVNKSHYQNPNDIFSKLSNIKELAFKLDSFVRAKSSTFTSKYGKYIYKIFNKQEVTKTIQIFITELHDIQILSVTMTELLHDNKSAMKRYIQMRNIIDNILNTLNYITNKVSEFKLLIKVIPSSIKGPIFQDMQYISNSMYQLNNLALSINPSNLQVIDYYNNY